MSGDAFNSGIGIVLPTRDKQKQVGGRLLGQGVYGCTFEPAPRCAGGQVFSRIDGLPAVGKVTDRSIDQELGVGRAIMALPLASQYFALPTQSCKPQNPITDPNVSKCELIEDTPPQYLSTMIMPLAGQELLKWSLDLPRLATNYRRIFIHLLEGMIIYQRAGYVHNDIHQGNILVDEAGVARYIDFGMAFKIDDVRNFRDAHLGTKLKLKHVWQPPELHLWRMIDNGVRVRDGAAQLEALHSEYGQLQHQFPTRLPVVTELETLATASSSINRRDGGAFVRAYGKRFDSWRIGLCMWQLWVDLLSWSGFRSTEVWAQRESIRSALNGLTQINPNKRMTAAKALAVLDPKNRMLGV
jgi:serine/threonine protein kinase